MFRNEDNNHNNNNQKLFNARLQLLRWDCHQLGQNLKAQILQHFLQCGGHLYFDDEAAEQKENGLDFFDRYFGRRNNGPYLTTESTRVGPQLIHEFEKQQKYYINNAAQTKGNRRSRRVLKETGPRKTPSPAANKHIKAKNRPSFTSIPLSNNKQRSQSARPASKRTKQQQRKVSSAAVADNRSRQIVTVPRPFRLSERPPIRCVYAERHLHQMLEAKRQEEDIPRNQRKFQANPLPQSTYQPDRNYWIGQIHRPKKVHPDRSQSAPVKSRIRPTQPVPLSTYLRPSPSMDELRALRKERQSFDLLAHSRGPIGLEEHSTRWHVQYRLRHSERCLASVPRPIFHAQTVPDFTSLQAEFEQKLAARRHVRPSTVPRPFRLSGNSSREEYNGSEKIRGHSCESWTAQDRRNRRNEQRKLKKKISTAIWR